MGRIKRLKRIRIHSEGTHILVLSALLLALVDGIICYFSTYTVITASVIVASLLIFGLTNIWLFVTTTLCCCLVFALFYMIVYRLTSHSYFSIVTGMRSESE